jgi:hypothetical protein
LEPKTKQYSLVERSFKKFRLNFNEMVGGRTKTRTWDPLIKSHQITLIYQAHFDISSVRSGIEPERKLENVETKIELGRTRAIAPAPRCRALMLLSKTEAK